MISVEKFLSQFSPECQREISRINWIDFATKHFWDFCRLREPDFYQDHREHLKYLCTVLDNFYYGLPLGSDGKTYRNLMINIPPQFGKTRTLINYATWILGRNNQERILSGAYNDEQAFDFSKFSRNNITETKFNPDDIVYSDIFPGTRIKRGDGAQQKWALEGQHFNFLAAGVGGTVTGKGGGWHIIDDLIKNAEDALNETMLDKAWRFYSSTFASRISSDAGHTLKRIVCMTRWSKDDPCGKILKTWPGEWFVIKMEAMDKATGKMLCEDFLPRERYDEVKKGMMDEIFQANYHQEPIDIQGRLYPRLKRYEKLPEDEEGNSLFEQIRAYCDTADEGADYLALGVYGIYQGKAYLLDVLYTKEGMEVTEPRAAQMLYDWSVNLADIESNSGGRGFARNVQRILWETHKTRKVVIHWFHQSKNKKSRLLNQSTNVMENVFFPVDAETRWPEAMEHLNNFQKEGKPAHDDMEDMITGVAENTERRVVKFLK